MERILRGFFATISLMVGIQNIAHAKDICLSDDFGDLYVFKNVANLKPGGAIRFAGIEPSSGIPVPIEATAALNAAGTQATLGMFVHGLATGTGGNNFTAEWLGDPKTFAGTGSFDADGTYSRTNEITFEPVDCKTVKVP
jgi:hypothetical protein